MLIRIDNTDAAKNQIIKKKKLNRAQMTGESGSFEGQPG